MGMHALNTIRFETVSISTPGEMALRLDRAGCQSDHGVTYGARPHNLCMFLVLVPVGHLGVGVF